MKPVLNQLLCSVSSLALIMPFLLSLATKPLMAMDGGAQGQNAGQTAQVGATGGDPNAIVGAVVFAGGDGDNHHHRTPSTREKWFIPVSVWAGTASLLCFLISAGWIIEHFVAGRCPDQPTRIINGTPVCPNITQLFDPQSDCSFARQQCNFGCK